MNYYSFFGLDIDSVNNSTVGSSREVSGNEVSRPVFNFVETSFPVRILVEVYNLYDSSNNVVELCKRFGNILLVNCERHRKSFVVENKKIAGFVGYSIVIAVDSKKNGSVANDGQFVLKLPHLVVRVVDVSIVCKNTYGLSDFHIGICVCSYCFGGCFRCGNWLSSVDVDDSKFDIFCSVGEVFLSNERRNDVSVLVECYESSLLDDCSCVQVVDGFKHRQVGSGSELQTSTNPVAIEEFSEVSVRNCWRIKRCIIGNPSCSVSHSGLPPCQIYDFLPVII